MAVYFNPSVSFRSGAALNNDGSNAQQPQTPVKDGVADVAKFFVSTSEMTKAAVKGGIYGFLAGTAVAGYKFVTKVIPNTFKEGNSILNAFKHPAKSLGWKGNLLAGAAALGVFAFHIVKGKLSANQKTADVDHQLYTGHRDK